GVWIVERIIDIVEQNPTSGINLSKIMVSGCGAGGKMALLTGAFCERVMLTVVAEAGILGGSSFRMSEYFRHGGGAELYYTIVGTNELPQGIDNIDKGEKGMPFLGNTANEIISSPEKVKKLPFDQHLLMACISPRPLIYLTNHQTIGFLGSTCEALSAYCAKAVWDALGYSDNFLFAMSPTPYKSCMLPQFHISLISNFYKRIFKGENIKIDNLIINSGLPIEKEEWQERWIDWKMEINLLD
ncbi:MAG: hypothetical protein N2053_10405, partial [Chitinispirillaceae bacterium]|nr:hypothetical protein [Chitinispirillaceae bacterium]